MSQPDPSLYPPSLPPRGSWPGQRRGRSGIWAGLILVLVGVYFLLRNFGLVDWLRWDYVWPVVIIVAGLYLVFRRIRRQ